jgi:predicted AlkP superfamily pyrophosphatase or phosphodiesterase
MRLLFSIIIICCFNSWVSAQTSEERPYVILISFDGFRNDYVERFDLPNFKKFINEGASAEGLIPAFPSKTFPNHYTIVTGLYPGHHGLVDNSFYDPKKNKPYTMRLREAVLDPDYYGGTPLWVLAKQQGMKSASYFWVGSELKQEALHPDYYHEYNQSVPFGERVDQVLNWLALPEAERPHLITLYFSSPDSESHTYGPLAEETKQTILKLDSLFGTLMDRVANTKLPVDVIVVSDHGMKTLTETPETFIALDGLVKNAGGSIIVVNGGTQAHVYTSTEEKRDSLFNVLQLTAKDYRVYKQSDFPARWHYNHQRSGDLLIVAQPGKYIMSGNPTNWGEKNSPGKTFGVHGYDPTEVNDMYGILYAKGPSIKKGVRLAALENIHVYPLICEILNLIPPKIDGDLREVRAMLEK